MTATNVDGAVLTPDILTLIKDFQNERCDWAIDTIDKVVDILLDVRDEYEATEILEILGCFRLLKLYLNDLKKKE
ncbi:MAG: hypothetical protein RSH25_17065 [Bacteroides sp.]|uniref:hypothetical protein n=1 Tax=Bacteroides sp. TaxID=29523 RepID=UPI002FC84524